MKERQEYKNMKEKEGGRGGKIKNKEKKKLNIKKKKQPETKRS